MVRSFQALRAIAHQCQQCGALLFSGWTRPPNHHSHHVESAV